MNVKVDSRKVKENDLFVALEKGHRYIEEAIKNGATRVVAQYGNYSVPTIIVEDTRKYLANYLKTHYQNKLNNIKLIGITGTNGKTTTAYLIYQALNKLGVKCSYIGTIGFYLGNKKTELINTTPDMLDVYEMLLKSHNEGCEYVVLEASSQGLDMRRLEGLEFDYAVFTNLSQDHLDYHLTMEKYALAKQELFKKIKKTGKAIINVDDNCYKYFLLEENSNITYGYKESDYQIVDYDLSKTPINCIVKNKENNIEFETSLIGKHNVYNSLVTLIILDQTGIDIKNIINTIKTLSAPVGRMDTIIYGDNKIIIDYAHTPDAVLNCIKSVKVMPHNKIYTIIGCGGNRDRTKRPEMARIATEYSDVSIFTSDNPRYEKIENIINDMLTGVVSSDYEVEYNREEAIKKGIQKLNKNDILLILGKGHETYQIIKDEVIHFDDKEKVIELIRR